MSTTISASHRLATEQGESRLDIMFLILVSMTGICSWFGFRPLSLGNCQVLLEIDDAAVWVGEGLI